MNTPASSSHRMNPEALGPLGDRPLAEGAAQGGPNDLFPGASQYLAARHQRRRQAQWNAVRPLAARLLRPDERLLYVAHAMQVPPVLHAMALGAMALPFHQVVLVITDARMIEVMLDLRGKVAGTRVRSFAWTGVRHLKLGFGRLTVVPAEGRKQAWRVPLRGDRRLLTALLQRLKPRLLPEGASHAGIVPLWHCPQCAAAVPREPESCTSCRTRFRSKRLASLLSVAFPGAGLLYAGHPFLATMDFLGEVFLYSLFVMLLLQADPRGPWVALGFGAVMFIMTKIQSVHMSRILTARTRPESESRRSGYGRFALIGSLASFLLIGGSLPLAGAARAALDQDLDHATAEKSWTGSRDRNNWTAFARDATARSQWVHPDGLRLTLFAYPQNFMASPDDLHRNLRESFHHEGAEIVTDDDDVPAPFHGFRMITHVAGPGGEPVALINYFIVDADHNDVHQAVAAVVETDAGAAEELMRGFLAEARFIPATSPAAIAAAPPAN